ncbi:indigoidine synthase A-like protein [Laetiporus sulphureus 93-53]|uniref:Indigoidine synthase A-like protein n=1 Tax=Laetiporus sulphureus 93-53 TaxID=1314785 RepID=A0A165CE10_9APHY|nr:indigoidine synthase A-like protein [Laetiporus sulphureus 93-53]KZT02641.1 indigoidine synthase A-like protein [Laetiporus sulphureus 93-53]
MLLSARRSVSFPSWYRCHKRTFSIKQNGLTGLVDIHPEVRDALANHKPVVALETTIVTHGMPYPVNLKTARSVENIVRSTGAVPATIGIIEGQVKIGLEPHELERLADVSKNSSVVKVSRRDIGPVIAFKRDGGTTCSATLIFAALAGIKVFATGGLGGVHRGGENSMDVSADLHELTRCPVGLVSAGVKSILDIGRTLEYLETLGVPVVSYAETNDFPAFYTRKSGFKSPWRVDDPVTAARILYYQQELEMKNGVLFGVPIPEQYETIGEKLQESVEQALKEADENGVNKLGKEATPWLLKRVGELTAGRSLASNVALIENTAHVGGQIAAAYSHLANGENKPHHAHVALPSAGPVSRTEPEQSDSSLVKESSVPPAKLVIIGSAAVDVTAQADGSSVTDPSVGLHSTVPGTVSLSLGGVGRNVAEAAYRTLSSRSEDGSAATLLISSVGQDSFGRLLVNEMERMGMRTDGLITQDSARSAICNLVLDSAGSLIGGVADMKIIDSLDKQTALQALQKHQPTMVALDGNLSKETLVALVTHCHRNNIADHPYSEPTSVPKSTNIYPAIAATLGSPGRFLSPISFTAPNMLELAHMYQEAVAGPFELTAQDHWWKSIDDMALGSEFRTDLEHLARMNACDQDRSKGTLDFLISNGIAQMAINLLPFFQHLVIKCGDRGVIVVMRATEHGATSWLQERSNVRGRYVVARNKAGTGAIVLKHYPAAVLPKEKIVNVTGAGDTLVGSMLATLLQKPRAFGDPSSLDELIIHAQRAAVLTLQSQYAVSPALSTLSTIP